MWFAWLIVGIGIGWYATKVVSSYWYWHSGQTSGIPTSYCDKCGRPYCKEEVKS